MGDVSYSIKSVRCTECLASTMVCFDGGYRDLFCSDEEIAEMWNRRVPGESVDDIVENGDQITRGVTLLIFGYEFEVIICGGRKAKKRKTEERVKQK